MAYQGFYSRLHRENGRLCCPLCEFTAGANAREVMLAHLRTVHHKQPSRTGELHDYQAMLVADIDGLPAPAWICGRERVLCHDNLAGGLPVYKATERDGRVFWMLR